VKGFYQSFGFVNSALFSLACFALSACANGNIPQYTAVGSGSNSSTTSLVSSASTTAQGAYTCPLDPNVPVVNDVNFNGTDQFTVCSDSSAPSQILIHGRTNSSDQICVIPAESTSSGVVAFTNVTIQCPEVQSGGIYVSYPNVVFNAVYIVEAPFAAQLMTCLETGENCPSTYSYGVFQ
jgi:hypothetical protein